jgi:hypothetical protein
LKDLVAMGSVAAAAVMTMMAQSGEKEIEKERKSPA